MSFKVLPLVDQFKRVYERYRERPLSSEEMRAESMRQGRPVFWGKGEFLGRVVDAVSGARFAVNNPGYSGLDCHIEESLSNDENYSKWFSYFPSVVPREISKYQKEYCDSDFRQVSRDINLMNMCLSAGQYTFHAGCWPDKESLITDRPLSTSLSPSIALVEADHSGKAYRAGRVDLLVLRVKEPKTRVFCFDAREQSSGHEMEVIFSTGANVKVTRKELICEDYSVNFPNGTRPLSKAVKLYMLEADIC